MCLHFSVVFLFYIYFNMGVFKYNPDNSESNQPS